MRAITFSDFRQITPEKVVLLAQKLDLSRPELKGEGPKGFGDSGRRPSAGPWRAIMGWSTPETQEAPCVHLLFTLLSFLQITFFVFPSPKSSFKYVSKGPKIKHKGWVGDERKKTQAGERRFWRSTADKTNRDGRGGCKFIKRS